MLLYSFKQNVYFSEIPNLVIPKLHFEPAVVISLYSWRKLRIFNNITNYETSKKNYVTLTLRLSFR